MRLAGRLVLLTLSGESGTAADAPADQKPLLWAADAEGGAPYVSMDPDHPGQYVGFEVDLIKALRKEIGRPIEFRQFNFTDACLGIGSAATSTSP